MSNKLFQSFRRGVVWVLVVCMVTQGLRAAPKPASSTNRSIDEKAKILVEFQIQRAQAIGNQSEIRRLVTLNDIVDSVGGPQAFEDYISAPSLLPCPPPPSEASTGNCAPTNLELVQRRLDFSAHKYVGSSTLDFAANSIPGSGLATEAAKAISKDYNEYRATTSSGIEELELTINHSKEALYKVGTYLPSYPHLRALFDTNTASINKTPLSKATPAQMKEQYPVIDAMSAYNGRELTETEKSDAKRFKDRENILFKMFGRYDEKNVAQMSAKDARDALHNAGTAYEEQLLSGQPTATNSKPHDAKPHEASQNNTGNGHAQSPPSQPGSKPNEDADDETAKDNQAKKKDLEKQQAKYLIIRDGARILRLLAGDNKEVQAVAMIAEAGASIALILTQGGAAGPAGMAAALVVVGLTLSLKQLFGDHVTPDQIILSEIVRLRRLIENNQTRIDNQFMHAELNGQTHYHFIMEELRGLQNFLEFSARNSEKDYFSIASSVARLNSDLHQFSQSQTERDVKNSLLSVAQDCSAVLHPSFRLKSNHPDFIRDANIAMRCLSQENFGKASRKLEDLGLSAGVMALGSTQRWWDPVDQSAFVKMADVVSDLKHTVGLDLRPRVPKHFANALSPLRIDKLQPDGTHLQGALIPENFYHAAQGLYALYKPVGPHEYPSSTVRSVVHDYQCREQPELDLIKSFLDLGVNQRAAFESAMPRSHDGKVSLKYLLPAVELYEAAVDAAIDTITELNVSDFQPFTTQFGRYDDRISLADQPFDAALATQDGFMFTKGEAKIEPCPGIGQPVAQDNATLKTPTLSVSPAHMHQFATPDLISPDLLKIRDVMGGQFRWCYDDIGIDDEKVSFVNEPTEKGTLQGTHSGHLGFTLRAALVIEGTPYPVANVRVTDTSMRRDFYRRNYTDNFGWLNSYLITPGEQPIDREKFDGPLRQKLLDILDSKKAQHISGGFVATGPYGPVLNAGQVAWDQRFSELEQWWYRDYGQLERALVGVDKGVKSTRVVPHPVTSKEGDEELRSFLLEKADRKLNDAFNKRMDKKIRELSVGIGQDFEKIRALDKARERVLQIVWLGVGDGIHLDGALRRRLLNLVDGKDIIATATADHPSVSGIKHQAREGTRELIKSFVRSAAADGVVSGHRRLDDAIELLKNLYWDRLLANRGCVPTRAQLPDALRSNFKTEEEFLRVARLGALRASPNVYETIVANRQKLLPFDRVSMPIAPDPLGPAWFKFEDHSLADDNSISVGEIAAAERVLRATFQHNLTPQIITERAPTIRRALKELVRSPEGMHLKVAEAESFLLQYGRADIPTSQEMALQTRMVKTLDDQQLSPSLAAQMKSALQNHVSPSQERVKALTDLLAQHTTEATTKAALLSGIDEKLKAWAKVSKIIEHYQPHFELRVVHSRTQYSAPKHVTWYELDGLSALAHVGVTVFGASVRNRIQKLQEIKGKMIQQYDFDDPANGLTALAKEADNIHNDNGMPERRSDLKPLPSQTVGYRPEWAIFEGNSPYLTVNYVKPEPGKNSVRYWTPESGYLIYDGVPVTKINYEQRTFDPYASAESMEKQLHDINWISDALFKRVVTSHRIYNR